MSSRTPRLRIRDAVNAEHSGRAALALQQSISYDDVLDLAQQSHPAALAIITEAGRALGRLIAAVANLTMAHTILVTGEGSRLAETVRDTSTPR